MAKVRDNECQASYTQAKHIFGFFVIMSFVSISCLSATFTSPKPSFKKYAAHLSVANQHFDGTLNYLHPLLFATKISSNDKHTLKEMLKHDDVINFMEAMNVEVEAHYSGDHWTPVLRSSLSPGVKTVLFI